MRYRSELGGDETERSRKLLLLLDGYQRKRPGGKRLMQRSRDNYPHGVFYFDQVCVFLHSLIKLATYLFSFYCVYVHIYADTTHLFRFPFFFFFFPCLSHVPSLYILWLYIPVYIQTSYSVYTLTSRLHVAAEKSKTFCLLIWRFNYFKPTSRIFFSCQIFSIERVDNFLRNAK